MRRREFITLLGGAAGRGRSRRARSSAAMPVIGIPVAALEADATSNATAFAQRLARGRLDRRSKTSRSNIAGPKATASECRRFAARIGSLKVEMHRRHRNAEAFWRPKREPQLSR